MGEPVPAALDYFGCDKQSPDGSCVGLITPQVSCVRAPEDCDKRSPDGRGTPWAEDSFISSCFTLCMDVWFMDLLPPPLGEYEISYQRMPWAALAPEERL